MTETARAVPLRPVQQLGGSPTMAAAELDQVPPSPSPRTRTPSTTSASTVLTSSSSHYSQPPAPNGASTNRAPTSTTPVTTPVLAQGAFESTTPRSSPSLHRDRDGHGQWTFRPLGSPAGVTVSDLFPISGSATSGASTPTPTPGGISPTSPTFAASQYPHVSLAARRQSLDTRRVRSDAMVPQRHMSVSMAKRPSMVTGGYESSSEEDEDDSETFGNGGVTPHALNNKRAHRGTGNGNGSGNGNGGSMWDDVMDASRGSASGPGPRAMRGLSIGQSQSLSPGLPGHAAPGHGVGVTPPGLPNPAKRHRAHTVYPHNPSTQLSAATTTIAPHLSSATLQGLGLMNSPLNPATTSTAATGRRRAQSLMSPTAPTVDRSPSTPNSSRRSSRLLRPPLGSPLSPRRVASSSGIPSGLPPSSAGPSPLHSRIPSESTHSRSTSMRSVRANDQYDQQQPGPSHPLSHPHSREGSIRESVGSASRKQKLRDNSNQRKRAFGTSLGLGPSPREAILSPDQIQDLLSDVDVSSAIQRMAAPPATSSALRRASQAPIRDSSPSRPQLLPTIETPDIAEESSPLPDSQSTRLTQPYLVSAPPALTSGDWPGRDRSVSVSSSIAPPMSRDVTPSRLRSSSLATVSSSDREIAPMPRTSSPLPLVDETAPTRSSIGTDGVASDAPPTIVANDSRTTPANIATGPSDGVPAPTASPALSSGKRNDSRRESGRRRISGLFGTMRRKRDSSPPPPPAPPPAPPPQQAAPVSAAAHPPPGSVPQPPKPAAPAPAASHAKQLQREQEMRIAEQERRDEEQAQERMYRATIQVRSHPASQRRAQKAALYLDQYYTAIYDGLEDPPKFNPLAVLRWTRRVEEQKAAKAKWEAETEMGSASRASGSLPPNSRRGSISSPQSDAFRMSLERRPFSSRPMTSTGELVVAPGWRYTLSDVQAYTACGGKIDFFIPPIVEPVPCTPPLAPMSPDLYRRGNTPSLAQPPSMADLRPRPSLASSFGEFDLSGDQLAQQQLSLQNANRTQSPALIPTHGDLSIDDGTMFSLSRTPSLDISRSMNSVRGHRGQHSTTGVLPGGAGSLTKSTSSLHVLKVPFEKLGSVARRNISLSASPQPQQVTLDVEDEAGRRPGWLAPEAPNAPIHSERDLTPVLAAHNHGFRDRVRRGLVNVAGSGRHDMGNNNTTGTSEDEQLHGFRKLFRGGSKSRPGVHQHTDSSSRVEAIRQLENIVGHERQLRHEVTAARHPTERERQAQEDLHRLENQIYEEREGLLALSRQRVDDMTNDEQQMTTLISHFLSAVDQAQTTFRTAADINVTFGNLDELRRPRKVTPIAADDESADSVGPLRGEDSATGHFSDGRNGRQTMRARKPSIAPALPNLAFVYGGYNRRSLVDPNLGVPIDPLQRLELSCQRARETSADMTAAREETTRKLQGMVESIHQLIRNKDEVRRWTARTLDHIMGLKDERDTLRLKIRGGIRPRLARFADSGIDLAARWILGIASYMYRMYRLVMWRSGESWIAWSLFGALLALVLGYFYMVGDSAEAAVPAGVS